MNMHEKIDNLIQSHQRLMFCLFFVLVIFSSTIILLYLDENIFKYDREKFLDSVCPDKNTACLNSVIYDPFPTLVFIGLIVVQMTVFLFLIVR